MADRLHLDALRTFDIAARRESLSAAAKELHLTDSAVSHQLKRLKQALGFELFERHGRTVRLSSAGRSFLQTLRPALDSIDEAAVRLREADGTGGRLTIACSSMFASRVLAPRLGRFAQSFPRIECYLRSMENDQVAGTEDMDAGILFGRGGWPGMWETRLASVRYSPVLSPKLYKGFSGPTTQPGKLLDHVIIHIDDGDDWRRWFESAGVAVRHPPRQLFTNDVAVAIEIARQSGGITLASDLMAASDLEGGVLVRPFTASIEVSGAWYLICSRKSAQVPRVRMFIAWLAQTLDLAPPRFT